MTCGSDHPESYCTCGRECGKGNGRHGGASSRTRGGLRTPPGEVCDVVGVVHGFDVVGVPHGKTYARQRLLTSEQRSRGDKLSPAPCEYHWIMCTIKSQNYGRHVSGGAHSEAPQAAVLAHSFCFSMRRVVSAKTFRIQTALSFMSPPPPTPHPTAPLRMVGVGGGWADGGRRRFHATLSLGGGGGDWELRRDFMIRNSGFGFV